MRCSRSEQLFEGRLEGTLTPRQRRELDLHLNDCARCTAVLEELRVIDALLLTPRELEPAPNFTFKVMAEIRTLPPPQPVRATWPMWAWFAIYLTLSWLAIGAWFAIGRPDGPAALVMATSFLQHFAGALQGVGRAIGSTGVAGVVTLVLIADLMLASAALYAGIVLRPRIAARLARSESV
jgi:hypothetical protein